ISTDYNPELKRSECLAVKNFKAGEQIFIFYGPRSNAELFIHNGFVFQDNQHDGFWLHLGMSKSDQLKEKRSQLLLKLYLPDYKEFWLKKCEIPISGQLLAFSRIFNMDEEQIQYWVKNSNVESLEDLNCNIEAGFQTKCWNFLLTRLKLILSTYKTNLEEDDNILSDKQLPRNKCLAVQMRATEKRILHHTIDYIKKQLKN
ncbi:hypothetical protein ILUMI_11431, partial [Ignelater luminosus]